MRNIIKCSAFIITSVLLCLLIYAPYVQAAPEPFYVNEETGHAAYLDDGAGIIVSSSETEEIEALKDDMKKITAYGGVALVTAAPSEQTEVYAEKRYREFFAADSGTLLLIDMRHRFIYVFSDGAIYKTVTKSYANTITDNAYRDATRGNYISCARLVFGQELALLQNRRIAQPMKHMNNALIAILTGLTVHFFRMTCKKRRKRPAAGIVSGAERVVFDIDRPQVRVVSEDRFYFPSGSGGGSSSGSGGSSRSGGSGSRSGSGGGGSSGGGRSSGGGGGHRF